MALTAKSRTVKRIRRLLSKRAARDDERVFVVEGIRTVQAALDAAVPLEGLYLAADAGDRCSELHERASELGIPVHEVAPGVIEEVSDTVTPQPVLAVAAMTDRSLDDLDDTSLVVVLADVREPGNAGVVTRSAEGAGASAVVFCRGSADAWSPKVVRASAGALFHVPVVRGGEPREVLDVLAQRGVRRLGTAAGSGDAYDLIDWGVPTALVLGNEAWGLPNDLGSHVDAWVTVPMTGRTESLNVATAASVLLFEAQRQRSRRSGSGR